MAKTKKDFTGRPGDLIGHTMYKVIKPLHKEGEKLRRARRRDLEATVDGIFDKKQKVFIKTLVFEMLPRAIENGGANFSRRDLYYMVRPLVYAHPDWEAGKALEYDYFSQTLLNEYQEAHGSIKGMWTDARGHLFEPHTRKTIGLGTREVDAYEFPPHTFDKIMYVEKEGELPKFQAAKLAQRFDMAIASAKGQSVVAARELLARAEQLHDYQLFVFHDADIAGYEIVRVLREATKRMPNYKAEVIDIGLTVADALEMGLDPEPFGGKKGVPQTLKPRLTPLELEYFGERRQRFELNAILPDTARIEYIERKLAEKGVRPKVIPPPDVLPELAARNYRALSDGWVGEIVDELIGADALKEDVAGAFVDAFGLDKAREYIEAGFKEDRTVSWRDALEDALEGTRERQADALKAAVEKRLRKRFGG